MHPTRRASIAVTLAVIVASSACTPAAQVHQPHVEPTRHTVTTRLEAAYDGRGQHIVVENRSSVDITVTSLHLRECENIRNRCEVVRLDVLVPAGQSRHITTVERRDDQRGTSFRYSWTWERVRDEPVP